MAHKLLAVSLSLGLLEACGAGQSPVAPTPSPSVGPVPTPTPSAPLPISGAYRLRISIDPECRDPFPEAFRIRSYDVDIRPAGDHSDIWFDSPAVVHLPETDLAPGSGYLSDGYFTVSFSFQDVVPLDQPSPHTFVVSASAAVLLQLPLGSPTVDGPLFADLRYADGTRTQAQCTSSSHHFVFTPR